MTRVPGYRAIIAMAVVGLAAGCAPQPPLDSSPTSIASTAPMARPEPPPMLAPPPPPPPPPPPAPASLGVEEVVVTGSRSADRGVAESPSVEGAPVARLSERAEARARRARPAASAPDNVDRQAPMVAPIIQHLDHERGPTRPVEQAGQLTAGDHDDLLNPRAYEAYARRFLERYGRQGFPLVDTASRVRVTVRGSDGRPAPFVKVEARTQDGRSLTLATKSDGQVVLFPQLDRLGRSVALTARAPGGAQASKTLQVVGGPQDVTLTLPSPARRVRALDIVLVLDTTGSMGDELEYLTAELADILTGVSARYQGLDVRTGMVFYRDLGDDYTVRTYPFTGDPDAVERTLAHQHADGGGDLPESMHTALAEANAYPWRDDAEKVLLLVADAPPHRRDMAAAWAAGVAARKHNIQIVPVAASGVEDDAQYLMRAMAAASQGRYVFITDDSGIGNAHAEPTVDCYLVTRLNDLISRVIGSLVSGQRIEPTPDEVVRRVGRYDRGVCRARR